VVRCFHEVHYRSCGQVKQVESLYIETALRPTPGEHHCVMVIAGGEAFTGRVAERVRP